MHPECEGGLDVVLRREVEVVELVDVPQEHLLPVGLRLVKVEQVDDARHLLVGAVSGLRECTTYAM